MQSTHDDLSDPAIESHDSRSTEKSSMIGAKSHETLAQVQATDTQENDIDLEQLMNDDIQESPAVDENQEFDMELLTSDEDEENSVAVSVEVFF